MRVKTQCLVFACFFAYSAVVTSAAWEPRELAVLDIVNLQRSFHGAGSLNGDNRLRESAFGHSRSMAMYDFFSHTTLNGPNEITPSARILAAGYSWNTPPFGQVGSYGENIAGGQGYGFPGGSLTEFDALSAARDVMYGTPDLSELSLFDLNVLGGDGFASWNEVGDTWAESAWTQWGTSRRSAGWMGSTGHRRNILNDVFTDLGVGYFWEPGDTAPILLDEGTFNFPLRTYWTQNFGAGDTDFSQVVPVPSAIWLFGSALLVGAAAVRRRQS